VQGTVVCRLYCLTDWAVQGSTCRVLLCVVCTVCLTGLYRAVRAGYCCDTGTGTFVVDRVALGQVYGGQSGTGTD
jgi:hypothetical protein